MDHQSPKRITLFGPPGSGKGTQAEKIQMFFGIPHIAPGNIFRKAVAEKTALGMQVQEILNAGNLVPDEITNALMKERIEQEDCVQGFVFDGYPRNAIQADALDAMAHITHVIVIDIPTEESIKRISHRRSCFQCGATYHLDFKPPHQENRCDVCGSELVQREDDTPAAIEQRLAIYRSETEPQIARFRERGIVYDIDGMGMIEEIWQRIQKIL